MRTVLIVLLAVLATVHAALTTQVDAKSMSRTSTTSSFKDDVMAWLGEQGVNNVQHEPQWDEGEAIVTELVVGNYSVDALPAVEKAVRVSASFKDDMVHWLGETVTVTGHWKRKNEQLVCARRFLSMCVRFKTLTWYVTYVPSPTELSSAVPVMTNLLAREVTERWRKNSNTVQN
jgi:hypothetical protein